MELGPGLYETLITTELAALIAALPDELVERRALSMAEAADRIGLYLNAEINRALADVPEDDRVGVSVRIAQRLFDDANWLEWIQLRGSLTPDRSSALCSRGDPTECHFTSPSR